MPMSPISNACRRVRLPWHISPSLHIKEYINVNVLHPMRSIGIFERHIVIHVGFPVTIFLSDQRDRVMGFTTSLSTSGRSFKKKLKHTRPTHACAQLRIDKFLNHGEHDYL